MCKIFKVGFTQNIFKMQILFGRKVKYCGCEELAELLSNKNQEV